METVIFRFVEKNFLFDEGVESALQKHESGILIIHKIIEENFADVENFEFLVIRFSGCFVV